MTAESLRRDGHPAAAVDVCRDALIRFPGHLSARVTLGWALLDLGKWREAQHEFETVRKQAPDNLAAIRGLAKLHTLHDAEAFGDGDATAPVESGDVDLPPAPVQWSAPPTLVETVLVKAIPVESVVVESIAPDPVLEPALMPADVLELAAYDLAMCSLGLDPAPAVTSTRYIPKFTPFEAFEPPASSVFERWQPERLTECA
jgi:hypothetical protein